MLFEFWWKICHDVGLQCSSFCRLAAECVPTSFSWFTLINHPDSKGRRNVVKQCEIKLWCMFSIRRIVTEGEKSAVVVFPRHSMARLGSARLCWTRCTFGTRFFFQSELSRAKLYPAVETQRTGPREYIRSERFSVWLGEGCWCVQEAGLIQQLLVWFSSAD